jgi:hypothetical protein
MPRMVYGRRRSICNEPAVGEWFAYRAVPTVGEWFAYRAVPTNGALVQQGTLYNPNSQSSPTHGGPKSLCGLLATRVKPAAW